MVKHYTRTQLKHMSKAHLIRIILSLYALLGRPAHHIKHRRAARKHKIKSHSRRVSGHKRHLRPGVHVIRLKHGGMRKVKVLQSGQWRFVKR